MAIVKILLLLHINVWLCGHVHVTIGSYDSTIFYNNAKKTKDNNSTNVNLVFHISLTLVAHLHHHFFS